MKRLQFILPYLTWCRGETQIFENEAYADSLIAQGIARSIDAPPTDDVKAEEPPRFRKRKN